MNAIVPEAHANEAALHIARSKVIDAFGEAERAILALLDGSSDKALKAPLSQKIAAARKIQPSHRYAKKRRDAVHAALDQLEPLLTQRAAIAHSELRVVRIHGEAEKVAGFSNPVAQGVFGNTMALYREDDLRTLASHVRAIAGKLTA